MATLRCLWLHVRLAAVAVFLASSALLAQVVTTTAGGYFGDGGSPLAAALAYPRFVARDSSGNFYISDANNHRIRKVSHGVITTFAGTGISGFSGDGGLARNAQLSYPVGLVFDSAGNLIIADLGNNRVRMVDPTGTITTIAGTGIAGFSGDGGPAILAEFNNPWGFALDTAGNLYVTDIFNQRVRKIDTSGTVTTVAGNGTAGYNGDGIPATSASLNFPRGIVRDSSGNLYIADALNFRVRKVDTSGIISTFAGDGMQGFSGDGGPAIDANVGRPRGLILRGNQLLIANAGQGHIRYVGFASGIINSLAGSFIGYDGDGHAPLASQFNTPTGLLLLKSGSLLVADEINARVRTITSSIVTTFAGGYIGDNQRATLAAFAAPENLAFDLFGNYYVADAGGNRIRKVDPTGRITTVAGTGVSGYSGDFGPATQAQLYTPFGVAADPFGNLFISDTTNLVIRKVDTSGTITTFASDPSFSDLLTVVSDNSGNLYVADDGNCVVHKITSAGAVSIAVGVLGNCGYNGDGIPATTALLNGPYGVAIDARGNLYLGDYGNNRVRKVNTSGIITTIAGNGNCGFSGDGGTATLAMLCSPEGVAIDPSGNLYIGDYLNARIRKVNGAGKINTVAGTGLAGYNGDNLPAASTNIGGPVTPSVDILGNIYFLDDDASRVRKIH
jgi:sugar lactone lactonase YvrE